MLRLVQKNQFLDDNLRLAELPEINPVVACAHTRELGLIQYGLIR